MRGALIVCSSLRELRRYGSAALDRDEENLRVEAPAFDGLQLEYGLRGGAGGGLEAALRQRMADPGMTARVTASKQRPKNWR